MSPKLFQTFGFAPHTRVLVAVSGGVDSMVLLDLAVRAPDLDVVVATFDHRLRSESRQEQAFVVAAAAQYQVPVVTGVWHRESTDTASEAAARQARYEFLAASAETQHATVVMTAHHADDQLETVLFRLGRSGDPAALVGIRADQSWHGKRLVRPLLGYSKAALRAYAQAHDIEFRDDASNNDTRYARNQLRHEVIPAYKRQNPQLLAHIQRFTVEQAGMLALAEAEADRWQRYLQIDPVTIDWQAATRLKKAAQLVLLKRMLRQWQPEVDEKLLPEVMHHLFAQSEHHFDLGAGVSIVVQNGRIRELVLQPAMTPVTFTQIGQTVKTPRGTFSLQTEALHCEGMPVQVRLPVTLRTRQAGDQVRLPNGVTQKLRRFFINEKVPASQRDQLLLLAQDHQVFWIEGQPLERLSPPAQTDILHVVLVHLPDVDRSEDR
ncbi:MULTISPECIES: tRNA lysidine(34) synthetase TilS [Lacticaseibacillus]|uniref:tRNA(Ile)-lysidine synthase n=1 Tax=Lacticaseibacillus casei DSM 20011 = JCM 1134 = ATCC 393 TaxID=1423732 RepID=A0AAD1ETM7_LACCA|nr:tRNA lysidine(34) synthetase TilS [Lacticaseibacillus casei]MBI6598142.1 tRNA lysidine(34) synthetase TilS [Lacticaseibacillus casei]MBO1481825.1 tRNA lysidine(34) synthetase TilS [Lacticaseibacillus casei]MBO2417105.1 tRNA lysidine(34) synthetase TilS [Lacticaseibacillus casei]MCK2081493.1 tRNA lysidine(34) synthetase TilS [Lacticaseibacillus casei]MDZ5496345.1 tRNA lysidine(34) synthetase TilS [Lacticaseibacillus casei]